MTIPKFQETEQADAPPIVSSDIIQDSHASLVDLGSTKVVGGDLVIILNWYDNGWGYSSQMVREAARIAREEQSEKQKAA